VIFGQYGGGKEELPRVIHIGINRFRRALPRRAEDLQFLVTIHEEGTGITWQRNARLDAAKQEAVLEATRDLHAWSLRLALTPDRARRRASELGALLHRAFVGRTGDEYLRDITPTAILLSVDETILNLPWEVMRSSRGVFAMDAPLGRLVSTRFIPKPGRDPATQDREVRILAVMNPTADLADTSVEIEALGSVEGHRTPFDVHVDVLERAEATRSKFAARLAATDYDIVHFAGHGVFDQAAPSSSAIRFADGLLNADDVAGLPWKEPPGFVFNSACESGRAGIGRRLVSRDRHNNGLAAAFIAAGTAAYAGYFWPVTDTGAGQFTSGFYRTLFERENVGIAFQEARRHALGALEADGDLAAYSAILYGDAASSHRRDLAMAA
jgi:CHAT domain-containing protein